MAEFDDIFEAEQTAQDTNTNTDKPFDKEEWARHKQEQREAAFEIIEEATDEVVGSGENFATLLGVMATFDRYSVNNALLVYAQKPDATLLRDSESWREDGIYIKKGEKGIVILTPGNEYTKDDGTTATSINTKTVFDISQVDTTPPDKKKHYDDRAVIKSLYKNSPVPVAISDNMADGVNAFYDHDKGTVYVRGGMEAPDIVKSLSQETAQALFAQSAGDYERSDYAFDSYCASYIVASRFGYDVSGYDFSLAPSMFDGMEPKEARGEMGGFRSVASDMISKTLRDIEPQRGTKTQEAR